MAKTKQVPRKGLTNLSYLQQVWAINRATDRLNALTGGIKEPRRQKSSHKALLEIRHQQQSTSLLIPKHAFQRLVREIASEILFGVRFETGALLALQEAAECFMTSLLHDANLCSLHARRVTILPRDLQLAFRIRGRKCAYFHSEE